MPKVYPSYRCNHVVIFKELVFFLKELLSIWISSIDLNHVNFYRLNLRATDFFQWLFFFGLYHRSIVHLLASARQKCKILYTYAISLTHKCGMPKDIRLIDVTT